MRAWFIKGSRMSSRTKASRPRQTTGYRFKVSGLPLKQQLRAAGVSTTGEWTLLSEQPFARRGSLYVRARCSCGIAFDVLLRNIVSGKSTRCRSCASLRRHRQKGHLIVHTDRERRLQKRGQAARARCENPSDRSYKNYGGRGIRFRFESVADYVRWVLEHLPHPTYKGVDIDRLDNNGHYEPGNLRLATRRQNLSNRRASAIVSWGGCSMPLYEWRENPYSYTAAARYVQAGLTGEEIIAQAWASVAAKRKGWQRLREKLLSTTC
jgi:hypothetical protein